MSDTPTTIGQLAEQVRSKNAGPFWMTLDIFLKTIEDYDRLLNAHVVTAERIGLLYRVDPGDVHIYEMPHLHAVKVSFPRFVPAGSFGDRDLHAGQQYLPLARLELPAAWSATSK